MLTRRTFALTLGALPAALSAAPSDKQQAQKAAERLKQPHHLKIETAHPSPLSARRGFFGSHPFSRTNDWLRARGQSPINWTHPEIA